jgi:hypothetical protein
MGVGRSVISVYLQVEFRLAAQHLGVHLEELRGFTYI